MEKQQTKLKMTTNRNKIPKVTKTLTYKSIKQAPDALKQILEHEHELEEIANKIKILNPQKIYFAGSGSSFNVAEYGTSLFHLLVKIPASAKTSLERTPVSGTIKPSR